MIYQNYHKHSYYSNPRVADSCSSNEEYAKRAAELGHGIISIMEHGWQGRYIEGYELAQKYNLKFVFGAEAYWVKDRYEKDSTNAHIYIAARNEQGRQAINGILSEANITGCYYQPRIDLELLFSLPPSDVIVTTACVGFWRYDDIEDIILQMRDHFRDNFFLEVQCHNVGIQKEINRRAIDLSNRYNIPIIFGADSHYVSGGDAWERTDYIASKGIKYEDDPGWILDYPDGETVIQRFADQGVLTHAQIMTALSNTNVFLEVETYDNPCFTRDVKMPTIYPGKTQEEKNELFRNLITEKWNAGRDNIPEDRRPLYEIEIAKEVDTVIVTNHADYFLLDYEIVKKGVELGGVITPSGRGSGVSFYINKLLGLTKVDRISADVKMYPERFMSATRILEARSLADIDLNLANPEIFAEAQNLVLGAGHSYPMLTYGTMKPKAAWKMYAKSQNIDFKLANEVSGQIERYESALKLANSEEERESICVLDFIDRQYRNVYQKSEVYQGIVSSFSIHPCSYLLYQEDIRKEIGLVKIKENLCCVLDGKWAEEYKFLKNDLLKVSVIELIDRIFKRISVPMPDVGELLDRCPPDDTVWDIYKNGWTVGINQVEQTSTKARVKKYAPQNISELCAFVAAVRPGFKSMYKTFESREPFSYNIKSLDDIIQTPQFPQSFILYQEMQMAVLNYAGIPMAECYEIIKNIAKKRAEKVLKYKDIFLSGFKEKMIVGEDKNDAEAAALAEKIWQILEDSARYSFNASHSYSVAIDSLYGAYLKTHYPLYFYEVFLNILEEKSDKDRMKSAKAEAESAFGISFPPMRFRQDNRSIVADPDNNAINMSLQSIKGFSRKLSEQLYEIMDSEFKTFVDLLVCLEENYSLSQKIRDLTILQYFQEFGNNGRLLAVYDEFKTGKNRYAKTLTDKTKVKRLAALYELENALEDTNVPLEEQLKTERELLGYIQCTYAVSPRFAYVLEVNTKFAPRVEMYYLYSGKMKSLKVYRKDFEHQPIAAGNIIDCQTTREKPSVKFVNGEFEEDSGDFTTWLTQYKIMR